VFDQVKPGFPASGFKARPPQVCVAFASPQIAVPLVTLSFVLSPRRFTAGARRISEFPMTKEIEEDSWQIKNARRE
jgi:hypothetical protein